MPTSDTFFFNMARERAEANSWFEKLARAPADPQRGSLTVDPRSSREYAGVYDANAAARRGLAAAQGPTVQRTAEEREDDAIGQARNDYVRFYAARENGDEDLMDYYLRRLRENQGEYTTPIFQRAAQLYLDLNTTDSDMDAAFAAHKSGDYGKVDSGISSAMESAYGGTAGAGPWGASDTVMALTGVADIPNSLMAVPMSAAGHVLPGRAGDYAEAAAGQLMRGFGPYVGQTVDNPRYAGKIMDEELEAQAARERGELGLSPRRMIRGALPMAASMMAGGGLAGLATKGARGVAAMPRVAAMLGRASPVLGRTAAGRGAMALTKAAPQGAAWHTALSAGEGAAKYRAAGGNTWDALKSVATRPSSIASNMGMSLPGAAGVAAGMVIPAVDSAAEAALDDYRRQREDAGRQ